MEDLGNFYYFRLIQAFLHSQIDQLAIDLLARTLSLVSAAALGLLTLWILLRGYRILTGRSHQPLMSLVTDSLRATLILCVASGMAVGGSSIYEFLGEGLPNKISEVVTGSDAPINEQIDRNLAVMQLALGSIGAFDTGGDVSLEGAKTRASYFAGIGTAGPAMTGGALLLFNQIALALFIGLGPLFVGCLLFEPTKPLFGRWLYYGIGTMFSLAVLSTLVSIALDAVLRVAAGFWISAPLTMNGDGLTALAMQQGGLGLILTLLIIGAAPMAAQFFNGVLGGFNAFSAFGGGGRRNQLQSAGPAYSPHEANLAVTSSHVGSLHGHVAGAGGGLDEIRRLSDADQNDFLKRYPNALASNEWVGNARGQMVPDLLGPLARVSVPPTVDSALPGMHISDERLIANNKAFFDILLTDPSARDEANVLRAQRVLREAGYTLVGFSRERNPAHPDGISGRWNDQTAAAIRAYKEAASTSLQRRAEINEQVTGNLQVPADPRRDSSSTFIELDGRRHDFIFAPSSYDNALDYGYTVQNAVQNVDIGTYLAVAEGAARISDPGIGATFQVSSGWRPNVGAPRGHPKGNGLDLSGIEVTQDGRQVSARFLDPGKRVGHDPSVPEPDLVRQYRESVYAIRQETGVRQIFNPWQMLYSQDGQWSTNHPRSQDDNDWIHRHHIHIGIKGYPER